MYKKLYKEVIDQAKKENRRKNNEIYYESHHIVPDFLFKNRKRKGPKGHLDGDPDAACNLVLLTFQEHLICHYYLYEIYKDTRYEYGAGSALQFFFIKATGNHERQRKLSEVDKKFLDEMAHLRQLGIDSISKARKGTMPVVDAVTRVSQGSVSVDHPNVLNGTWVHHSKGKPSPVKPENRRSQKGSANRNYKEMTPAMKTRVFMCVVRSIEDNYLVKKTLEQNIKKEFTEFKKVSMRWILNNFVSMQRLVTEANEFLGTEIIYDSYYRSKSQREKLSIIGKSTRWVTNGIDEKPLKVTEVDDFLQNNPEYTTGRRKIKEEKNAKDKTN